MKIGILGWDHGEVDVDIPTMVELGRELGHEVTLFVLDEIECVAAERGLTLTLGGEPAGSFDVLISRAQLRTESWRADVERLSLASNIPGVPILDPVAEFISAESKLGMMHQLGHAGLPVPPTCGCRTYEQVRSAYDRWGSIVLKGAWGFGGHDVERVLELPREDELVHGMLARYGELVCQPYVPSLGGDVRITIVGDEDVFNVHRVPQGDEWRANVGLGAKAEPYEPTPELVELARRAARAMGITIAGVDLMPTADGFLIIEVNNVPGGLYLLGPEAQRRAMTAMYDLAVRTADRQRAPGPAPVAPV
ncbi:RimK family alpha-L-glutamate ligase [Plantactinospora siamensis]|uniref:RimK family alpha-L-glutamate ligase n=1 Tax=Plantactinospora siamensis TaxID=555372 RepID=A0ABV6NS27_9ACTN